MSHELRLLRSDGKRKTVTETFKLGRDKREALTAALLREGKSSRTISDLLGCSTQCVREVKQRAEMGSETPETSGSEARNRGRQGDCPSGTERGVVSVSGDRLYVSGSPGYYCAHCGGQLPSAEAVYDHIETEHPAALVGVPA
jgi:hypothetical protein